MQLNDASLLYEPETSIALGFGFRCGFLGLCTWRLFRSGWNAKFNLDLVTTAPSVIYKVIKTDGTELWVDNPTNLPDPVEIDTMEEPIVDATIMVPSEYLGAVMELCQERREPTQYGLHRGNTCPCIMSCRSMKLFMIFRRP